MPTSPGRTPHGQRLARLDPDALLVPPGAGRAAEGAWIRKVSAADLGGPLTVAEARLSAGETVGPRTIDDEDRVLFVVSGTLHCELGDRPAPLTVPARTYLVLPHGVSHCFRAAGDTDAHVLELRGSLDSGTGRSGASALTPAAAGERSALGLVVKVPTAAVGQTFCTMENQLPPGTCVPWHTHLQEDQIAYVLSGALEFQLGGPEGPRLTAPAGSFVIKPRGVPHAFWNATDETVDYIELTNGPTFEGFVTGTWRGQVWMWFAQRRFAVNVHLGWGRKLMRGQELSHAAVPPLVGLRRPRAALPASAAAP